MEVGAALILSIFIFPFNETVTKLDKKVKTLEERIKKLEEKR